MIPEYFSTYICDERSIPAFDFTHTANGNKYHQTESYKIVKSTLVASTFDNSLKSTPYRLEKLRERGQKLFLYIFLFK